MIPLLLIVVALLSYFIGSLSSAELIAKFVLHKDLSRVGTRKVNFNNFERVFGMKWGAAAIAADAVKSAVAVLIGGLLLRIPGDGFPVIGKLFAGFFLVLGDVYPIQRGFHGGKGLVCLLVALWIADWRVGIFATGVFVAVLALTQFLSLSTLASALVGMIGAFVFVDSDQLKGLAGLLVLFSLLAMAWRLRANIGKLIQGKEQKMNWGRRAESRLREDRF